MSRLDDMTMSHWSTIVSRAATKAREGRHAEIPVADARDRMFVQAEARSYPDLLLTYVPRLGIIRVELREPLAP